MKKSHNILDEIKKSSVLFETMKRTESKSPLIKKVLLGAIENVEEDESLPSIRNIAKALGTAILPVHKAITELKEEGVIIAKSTSGFFKAYSSKPNSVNTLAPDIFSAMFGTGNINLRFAVESTEPYQRSFWQKIVNSEYFNTQNPFVNIEMVFKPFEFLKNVEDYNIDIIETSPLNYYRYNLKNRFLRIKDYLNSNHAPQHAALFDDQLMTPYGQTFFLFYNSDFIDKNRLPEPEFKNFDEQRNYFDFLADEAKDLFMGSCIPPVMFMGKYFDELMKVLMQKTMKASEEAHFEKILNNIVEFCALFDYKPHTSGYQPMNFYFDAGSMPFFIGNSVVYWRLLSQKLPFNWKVYPLFSIDNSCIRYPIYTGVTKGTKDPLNAFQFLSFLFTDNVQKNFAEIGFIPANLDLFNIKCLNQKQNNFFRECFKKNGLPQLTNHSQFYIQNFIFSPQLLEKAMNHKKQNYSFKRIFHLARTYFNSHKE